MKGKRKPGTSRKRKSRKARRQHVVIAKPKAKSGSFADTAQVEHLLSLASAALGEPAKLIWDDPDFAPSAPERYKQRAKQKRSASSGE